MPATQQPTSASGTWGRSIPASSTTGNRSTRTCGTGLASRAPLPLPPRRPYQPGIQFIERADQPFLLYQSYYTSRTVGPSEELLEHYREQDHAGYYASVTNLDWNTGRLIDALRSKGVLDETMIILTTEHARTGATVPARSRACASHTMTPRAFR
jgi:arylsulfatase A-like enzyme